MNILSLELKNYRNYDNALFSFSEGTNFIYGDNAQGKTNALEAIYVFAFGKSFRTTQDKELINFNKNFTRFTVKYNDSFRENVIEITILKDKKKQVKVNGVVIRRLSELIGKLNVVLFSPAELNLIKGGPNLRRRFLDMAISQLRPNYCHLLDRYAKTLEQRNNLLRKIKYENFDSDTLFVWDEKLAEYGEQIIKYRIKFSKEISAFSKKIHSEICHDELLVSYMPKCIKKEDILAKLIAERNREIEQGCTLVGPHRDEISIMISNKDAKIYASQGQQRTAVLALKLAQAELIFAETGERPVLLLDDMLSELDVKRRRYIAKKITSGQVIITCTDAELLNEYSEAKKIHIKNGEII